MKKELTLKEIESLLGYEVKVVSDKPQRKLSDVPVGETFKLGDMEFIVLYKDIYHTHVILKDFWITDNFDYSSNDYRESSIRKKLNTEFYNKLISLCGSTNVVEHDVELTSNDGRKDYGSVKDYVSLITCDKYRKYVDIFDKYRTDDWWWTATPYSTKSNGYGSSVCCVYYDSTLDFNYCRVNDGVRPFCILKSNIFVY